jgi:hypothetical protein
LRVQEKYSGEKEFQGEAFLGKGVSTKAFQKKRFNTNTALEDALFA